LKIYRIAKKNYIKDLSGEGARLFGGRWNKPGNSMVYFSEYLSLCVLEILVHTEQQLLTNDYHFLEVEIPESEIEIISLRKLFKNWRTNPPVSSTQDYGTNWLASQKNLALKVPSAVLPHEYNILINPNHKHFSKVKIICKSILDIDSRVLI
jgi:RES domain-containing protein